MTDRQIPLLGFLDLLFAFWFHEGVLEELHDEDEEYIDSSHLGSILNENIIIYDNCH
jgi:hypothetical protein